MRSRILALVVLLAASAFLVSCEQQLITSTGEEVSKQLQPFEGNHAHGGHDDIGIIISSNRGVVDEGEPVELRFTVINRGDEKRVIELEDKPVMDIMVRYLHGEYPRVYWSNGREITADMRRLELGPGESKTIEMTWIAEGPRFTTPDVFGILNDEYGETKARILLCIGSCGGY